MALPQRRTHSERPNDSGRQADAPGADADWRDHYQIQDPDDVEAFLREHPNVAPVLARASSEIAARFGDDTRLVLTYVADPEDEPPSDFLSLGICTSLDDDEAYARRDQLDDEWWNDAMRAAPALLVIDLARR